MPQLDLDNMVLNDITVELVTNAQQTGVFDKLMSSVNSNIDEQYKDNRITGSDYANVYLGSIQSVLAQSIQFVLQEQLQEAQISSTLRDNDLKAKQYEIACLEVEAKQFEVTSILPEQLTKMQEEIDLLQTQDSEAVLNGVKDRLLKDGQIATETQNTILVTERHESEALNNSVDGVIENQINKIKEDILVSKEQVAISKTKTATEKANSIANIDKVLGYDYILDVEGNIVVGIDTQDGKLDYEKDLIKEKTESEALNNGVDGMIVNQVLKIKEDILVAKEQVSVAKTQTANEKANSIANIDKVLGYAYTLDINDNILIGADTLDGKLDYEKDLLKEQTESEALNNAVDGMIENQINKIKEDILVSKEQVSIAKTKTATEQANSIANIDKVLGYAYTLDGDGNIVVGLDTADGKLDAEVDSIVQNTANAVAQEAEILDSTTRSNTELTDKLLSTAKQRIILDEEVETADLQQIVLATEEEIKTAQLAEISDSTVRSNTKLSDDLLTSSDQRDNLYTDKVLKDKQVAKLGLDNVMKSSEASRDSDDAFIYVPKYVPGA